MSNYSEDAIHPKTKKVEHATFIDNHFGRHKYGVRFPSDDTVWPIEQVELAEKAAEVSRGPA